MTDRAVEDRNVDGASIVPTRGAATDSGQSPATTTAGCHEWAAAPDASPRSRVTDRPAREARPSLPTDPATLPPLGPGYDASLDAGMAALGITLTPGVRAALEAHGRLLLAWNEAINLTALRTPDAVARLHVLDSLAAVDLVRRVGTPRPSLLDLGSGGGYPGLPLGAALPAGRIRLVDSIAKKARFLAVAAAAVGEALRAAGEPLPEMSASAERAEVLARRPDEREGWDIVTCRAVGSLADVAELALPLLRPGGSLILWKRDRLTGSLAAELEAACDSLRALGGRTPEVVRSPGAALPGHVLVLVGKVGRTPGRFPRPPGRRRRSPAEPRRPLLR